MSTYTIKQGDTLFEIAKTFNIALKDLEAANPGVDPRNLKIGQVIRLPGAPQNTPNGIPGSQGGTNGGGNYVHYHGPASNFPNPSQWAKYDFLWRQNSVLMKFNNSDSEIAHIRHAIEKVASESGIDVRVILCVIMQESGGNVRVRTTFNGVRNPGIMQSHNGVEFDPARPAASILQMVRDGTEGTKHGDGLKQLRSRYGNYYEALRAYNSGSVNRNDLNDPIGATADYVQETANRLMGHSWQGM
jgi:LysM repeat protein